MSDLSIFMASGGGLLVLGLARQLRLHLRERAELKLAKHMFDQTRSTQALDGYIELVDTRNTSNLERVLDYKREKEPSG